MSSRLILPRANFLLHLGNVGCLRQSPVKLQLKQAKHQIYLMMDKEECESPSQPANNDPQIHEALQEVYLRHAGDNNFDLSHFSVDEFSKWSKILSHFKARFGRFSHGNQIQIYGDGNKLRLDMLEEIKGARELVWFELYIIDDSEIAQRYVKAMCDAARRGCQVILAIDYWGSLFFPFAWITELKKAGVVVKSFNAIFNGRGIPLVLRNHRKLLIVDGEVAYCGSANVSEKSEGFYDIHVKVKGPCVYDLGESMLSVLKLMMKKEELPQMFPKPKPIANGSIVQVLESNMLESRKDIQESLCEILHRAEKSVYLTSSYFQPPGALRRALMLIKRKGVELSLLLSGKSDVHCDTNATIHVIQKFYRKRVAEPLHNMRIHFTRKHHCHGKAVVIDGWYSSVGSFNWDRASGRRNLELSLGIFDERVAECLKRLQVKQEHEGSNLNLRALFLRPMLLQWIDKLNYQLMKLYGRNTLDGLSNNRFKFKFRRTFIRTHVDQNVGEIIAMSKMASI